MAGIIDTHAHLNDDEVLPYIDEILERAKANGVEKIIVPATNLKSSIQICELVQKHEMLYGAVGIHPNELNDFDVQHLEEIEKLADSPKIVAIGEIGLDYYWKPFDAELEKFVLREQLKIAKRKNLPVILHNRESSEDLINLVSEEYESGKLKGQFHSFSGDETMAKKCVEMGFYISFTGNITYKPNEKTLTAYEIVKQTPLTSLLLETDTPYLPPIPYRGKKNEPSYIIHTAKKIAELKNISEEEVYQQTTANANELFKLEKYYTSPPAPLL